MKKNSKKKLVVICGLLLSVMGISVASYFAIEANDNELQTDGAQVNKAYEKSISQKSSGTTRNSENGTKVTDYNYSFNNPSYLLNSEKGRKSLLNLECDDRMVTFYNRGKKTTKQTEKFDENGAPFDPKQYDTITTSEGPIASQKSAYTCENGLLSFESFSDSFDSSHILYRFNKMMGDGSILTIPLLDDLQAIRIHSDDRVENLDPSKTSELFLPEAEDFSLETDSGPQVETAAPSDFALWGRWAEAVYSRTLSLGVGDKKLDLKVNKYASRRWLSVFFDYFTKSAGASCLDVWGDFDTEEYFWTTLITHEMYHHLISPSIRDSSLTTDPQIDYSYNKLIRESGVFISERETEKIRSSLWDVVSKYFSSLKNTYWDNNNLVNIGSERVNLSNNILGEDVNYSLSQSELQYIYEPEEIVVRLMSLLTFYWDGLDPDLLSTRYSPGYDICKPSFVLKDYLSFKNENVDINPFTSKNYNAAVEVILNFLKFNQEIAFIKKGNWNEGSISFQGWSKPGEYDKIVFEEINPLAGSVATKRYSVDLSWASSNFFVRPEFNSPEKQYIECSDDLANHTFVKSWANSCQLWTTPSIDVNSLFEDFFTQTSEQNIIYSENENAIYTGFNVYFWNDLNSDGVIQDFEKKNISLDQKSINSRLMSVEPSTDCKVSLINNNKSIELRRYVDYSYRDITSAIDDICDLSWSS